MPVIIGSIVLAGILAAGAGYVLLRSQEPVYEAQPLPSVRVGNPGYNLVGPDWSGLNKPGRSTAHVTQAEAERK